MSKSKVQHVAELIAGARWPGGGRLGVSPVQALIIARLLEQEGYLREESEESV